MSSSSVPSSSPTDAGDNNNNGNNTRPSVSTTTTTSFPSQDAAAAASASASSTSANVASRPQQQRQRPIQGETEINNNNNNDWTEQLSTQFEDRIGKPSREAIHSFFYPPRNQPQHHHHHQQQQQQQQQERNATTTTSASATTNSSSSTTSQQQRQPQQQQSRQAAVPPSSPLPGSNNSNIATTSTTTTTTPQTTSREHHHHHHQQQHYDFSQQQQQQDNDADQDTQFVHHFWTTYDDILILSLFTQVGIVFRLAVATWFGIFDNVFNNDSSPLFTNLPLNCLSCFCMGLFCSGERLMEIIATRFSPPVLQQDILHHPQHHENDNNNNNKRKHGGGRSRQRKPPSRESSNEGDGLYQYQDGDDDDDDDNDGGGGGGGASSSSQHTHTRSRQSSFDGSDDDPYNNNNTTTFSSSFWNNTNLDDSFSDFIQMPHEQQQQQSTRRGGGFLRRRRRRRRRDKTERYFHSWQPPVHLNEDLRDVQLLALERRIRASKCLLLFPVRKQDVDVMEHYFHQGYKRRDHHHHLNNNNNRNDYEANHHHDDDDDAYEDPEDYYDHDYPFEAVDYGGSAKELTYDLELNEHIDDENEDYDNNNNNRGSTALDPLAAPAGQATGDHQEDTTHNRMQDIDLEGDDRIHNHHHHQQHSNNNKSAHMNGDSSNAPCADSSSSSEGDIPVRNPFAAADAPPEEGQQQQQQGVDQIITDVTANVTENISRFRRANIADGWDAGTTPEAMSDDLMLGLRDGFCGALSSFSSWVSTMVNLMRQGKIGQSFVGLVLGLQLPILAYRFGQHVAVYIFVWRARFESKRDARRGYGIRVAMDEQSEREASSDADHQQQQQQQDRNKDQDEIPSVRAIVTALFIMALVTQCTSLSFYGDPEHQQMALSLLFSPLGVLARWRLSKYNTWRPTFPLGTFTANLLACALSGSLGSLLAGNPGPRESIVLQSIVAGFGGTMSSLATFIVEILAGIDPILFRFDGIIYAVLSICWAMVICFLLSAAGDWADTIENSSD